MKTARFILVTPVAFLKALRGGARDDRRALAYSFRTSSEAIERNEAYGAFSTAV